MDDQPQTPPPHDPRIRRKVWAATAGAFAVGGASAITFAGALAILITGAILRHGVALSPDEVDSIHTVVTFLVSGATSAVGALAGGWITPERSPPA